jgi:uncharacterized membrane protein (DUF106 family)
MKNKLTLGIIALVVVGVLTSGFVAAFGFGNGQAVSEEERTEMQEFHGSIQETIENEDYEAWKSLMESRLTEEQFDEIIERHAQMSGVRELRGEMREAYEAGDDAKVEELQTELAEYMPEGKGFGRGHGKGFARGECPYRGI